jgi:hypothetical protein
MHRRKVVLVNTSASFHTVYSEFSTSSVGLLFGVFRWLLLISLLLALVSIGRDEIRETWYAPGILHHVFSPQ